MDHVSDNFLNSIVIVLSFTIMIVALMTVVYLFKISKELYLHKKIDYVLLVKFAICIIFIFSVREFIIDRQVVFDIGYQDTTKK
ncbi:hypothetical protein A8L45_04225 [Veronia pacifica]|uniref:Uncharacterized protein n=1 Tax=Veronia pacifica TaxID=1080227 RepID=A0A1C3EQ50_9GAMM|nr:hypothetical protein A8L45_04225 [Veronia pacifica]